MGSLLGWVCGVCINELWLNIASKMKHKKLLSTPYHVGWKTLLFVTSAVGGPASFEDPTVTVRRPAPAPFPVLRLLAHYMIDQSTILYIILRVSLVGNAHWLLFLTTRLLTCYILPYNIQSIAINHRSVYLFDLVLSRNYIHSPSVRRTWPIIIPEQ